jgi:hypothetical protein
LVLLVGLVSVTLVHWLMPFPRGAGTARWMPASEAEKTAIVMSRILSSEDSIPNS